MGACVASVGCAYVCVRVCAIRGSGLRMSGECVCVRGVLLVCLVCCICWVYWVCWVYCFWGIVCVVWMFVLFFAFLFVVGLLIPGSECNRVSWSWIVVAVCLPVVG